LSLENEVLQTIRWRKEGNERFQECNSSRGSETEKIPRFPRKRRKSTQFSIPDNDMRRLREGDVEGTNKGYKERGKSHKNEITFRLRSSSLKASLVVSQRQACIDESAFFSSTREYTFQFK
jgi:hypothetical protein